ncbi:MAG TPA: peptidoglycan-binding domain-containing protein, partial [Mycobacteriales bacterium]|nr:peptidoglycan-binding domain-containing protein [Mycobacteriales bacterium]
AEEPTTEPTTGPTQEPAPAPAEEPAPAPEQPGTTTTTSAPALTEPHVSVFGPGQVSEDIRTWQARMAERGWEISVDGIYGPQTASVAARFQAEKGLAVDGLVGPQTWAAAWETPIT